MGLFTKELTVEQEAQRANEIRARKETLRQEERDREVALIAANRIRREQMQAEQHAAYEAQRVEGLNQEAAALQEKADRERAAALRRDAQLVAEERRCLEQRERVIARKAQFRQLRPDLSSDEAIDRAMQNELALMALERVQVYADGELAEAREATSAQARGMRAMAELATGLHRT